MKKMTKEKRQNQKRQTANISYPSSVAAVFGMHLSAHFAFPLDRKLPAITYYPYFQTLPNRMTNIANNLKF